MGTPRGAGRGAAWAREVLAAAGAPAGLHLRLLTQPRFLGLWFNPVSFWLALQGERSHHDEHDELYLGGCGQ